MKSGVKTTEFWCHALGTVGLVVAAVSGALPPQYAAIGIGISQAVYSISRGLAKQTQPGEGSATTNATPST